MSVVERMISHVCREAAGIELKVPFPRMTYQEAVGRYGSDKPDLRFEMLLHDLSGFATQTEFKVFRDAVAKGGIVKALIVPGGSAITRTRIDALGETAKSFGAKGLAWVKITADGKLDSVIAKFLDAKQLLKAVPEAKPGDLLLCVADQPKVVHDVLGRLRLLLGDELKLNDLTLWRPVWVLEFPLLEYDQEAKRDVFVHNPFAAPLDEEVAVLDSAPLRARGKSYDLLLNGNEIGGGGNPNPPKEGPIKDSCLPR